MDDDFNTAGAIAVLFDMVRLLNKFADDEKLEAQAAGRPAAVESLKRGATTFRELAVTLGLFRRPPAETAAAGDDALLGKVIELLIKVRADARKKKDFAMADAVRNGLNDIGIVLEDRPSGTEWARK
jgi:cysteinyl-tRNA synthetase